MNAPAQTEKAKGVGDNWRRIEKRQWWLSLSGIVVSLILTVGILSFFVPGFVLERKPYVLPDTGVLMNGLAGLVLLFDLYVVFQQVQIYRFRQRIAEREELFGLISENAADMIAVVNVDGTRVYNSPSYQRLLGYSLEELRKTSAFDQIHPDDRSKVMEASKEATRTGMGRRVEYRIRHRDGHWISLESTASVVKNSNGEVEKLVIVNRDVTERKQLEEQLHLSQKIEAIGRLSGGIAHDFNNLLGVIIGYTEALQKKLKTDHPYREAIDEIQHAGKRAAALTQQLLAFSRKQVLEPTILDLNAIAADVEKMLGRLIGEDIDLNLVLSNPIGLVKADRTQIEQVLLNLAVNARDAMPKGGKLTIETANVEFAEDSAKRPQYMAPGRYVLLKVTDTGCGMDAKVQAHMFEPFFTTKEKGKGTGLGLATVYGVIKQSGGYILVESEVGKGSAFEIYLPQADAVLQSSEAKKPQLEIARRHHAVLLVEDEASLRKLTRNVLEEAGYAVFEASDAFQALDLVDKKETHIDLLLTDVVMPRMSGRALADLLARSRPEVKVLYMSGYTDGEIAPHGVLDAGTSILRKPFTHDELIQRVEEVLSAVPQ